MRANALVCDTSIADSRCRWPPRLNPSESPHCSLAISRANCSYSNWRSISLLRRGVIMHGFVHSEQATLVYASPHQTHDKVLALQTKHAADGSCPDDESVHLNCDQQSVSRPRQCTVQIVVNVYARTCKVS